MNEQTVGTTRKTHRHGLYEHKHAHADIRHHHILQELCRRPECRGSVFHTVHPGPEHIERAKQLESLTTN